MLIVKFIAIQKYQPKKLNLVVILLRFSQNLDERCYNSRTIMIAHNCFVCLLLAAFCVTIPLANGFSFRKFQFYRFPILIEHECVI